MLIITQQKLHIYFAIFSFEMDRNVIFLNSKSFHINILLKEPKLILIIMCNQTPFPKNLNQIQKKLTPHIISGLPADKLHSLYKKVLNSLAS